MLFNDHPTGHMNAGERLDALMGAWRHSDLWQRPELRRSLPQGDPPHDLHRPCRKADHAAHDQTLVRSVRIGC